MSSKSWGRCLFYFRRGHLPAPPCRIKAPSWCIGFSRSIREAAPADRNRSENLCGVSASAVSGPHTAEIETPQRFVFIPKEERIGVPSVMRGSDEVSHEALADSLQPVPAASPAPLSRHNAPQSKPKGWLPGLSLALGSREHLKKKHPRPPS